MHYCHAKFADANELGSVRGNLHGRPQHSYSRFNRQYLCRTNDQLGSHCRAITTKIPSADRKRALRSDTSVARVRNE